MSARLAIEGGSPVRPGPPIPLSRPSYGWDELREVLDVFEGGTFCAISPTARKVADLEQALAEVTGARHVVVMSSGSNAQHATLMALNIGPGDEVIVPSLTFYSTAYTVLLQGATPVFADVSEATITLDPQDVARRITSRTRAIVPVHWFGRPAEMDPLLALAAEHGIAIVEDCAHGFGTVYRGRPVGTIGALGAWSMQESKLITAAGDGGFVTTNDERLALEARMARDHGRRPPRPGVAHDYGRLQQIGNHYRLTEIQAAFALAQARRLPHFRAMRRRHTEALDRALRDVPGLAFQDRRGDLEVSYAYYPVRFLRGHFTADIDAISAAILAEGISTYPIAKDEMCHVQPVFVQRRGRGTLPVSERIGEELLLLPLFPDLSPAEIDDVIGATLKVAEAYRARTAVQASLPA
jgi:dTDP-4-amino-4,6-dideoxygalactose transaminase